MFQTIEVLPTNATLHYEINLKLNKFAFYVMNVLSLVMFIVPIIVYLYFKETLTIDSSQIYFIALGTIIYIILHEFVHALCFKIKNKVKVKFRFHGFAISASVPDRYYQKSHQLINGLAPLVVFSFILLSGVVFLPSYWSVIMFILFSIHLSGCTGDLYVCFKILLMPGPLWIRDYGIGMEIYHVPKSRN